MTVDVSRALRVPLGVRRHLETPLFRNSYALVVSGGVSMLLGLGFWALAVRLFPAEEVGRTSAAVSTMTLLAAILQLNLTNGLIRFLPESGRRTGAMLRSAYGIAAISSLVGGALFVAITVGRSFLAGPGGSTLGFALLFVVAVPVWSVFVMQDAALIGLRAAGAVPVENAVFSVLKIALLVPFAAFPQLGMLGAWMLAASVVIVPLNTYIARRLLPRHAGEEPTVQSWWEVRRYLGSDYTGGLLETGFVAVLPILVTAKLGLVANAYFYTSWIVVTGLELVLFSIGSSLTAEGAHHRAGTARFHAATVRLTAAFIVPVVGIGVLIAPWLLAVYGPDYVDHGTTLFRLLLLAMPLRAIVALRLSVLRVERRGAAIVRYQGANAVLLLVGGYVALGHLGLPGMGLVFLATQALLAASVGIGGLVRRIRRESS
ncbi:lipopolysaccharide biosynthesis protein [Actinomycetospora sp. TBRC 11914]|uniref:lipopolysaccharide biosynthesis protein n=1 Tax=Actinomycetospora sp. TBRC 11914 TaxID=2729387 RepID=UPI00145EA8FE|nr:oligosaccharide flippase family protein [Actinomycetospora sp. TBRC 11914]NMO90353.1 oligosaccharide flippase family protein [Actinomycetospora sp. TBRC 11914]